MKILNAYKYFSVGVLPPPTEEKIQREKEEWYARYYLALYMGLTDISILKGAKKAYADMINTCSGKGTGGWETWEKDCEPSRKSYFISQQLPELESFRNKAGKKIIIATLRKEAE